MAVPMLWLRQRDAIGALGLAGQRVARAEQRPPRHLGADRRALVTAQELWRAGAETQEDDERKTAFRAAIQLVNLADMVALTTRA